LEEGEITPTAAPEAEDKDKDKPAEAKEAQPPPLALPKDGTPGDKKGEAGGTATPTPPVMDEKARLRAERLKRARQLSGHFRLAMTFSTSGLDDEEEEEEDGEREGSAPLAERWV
jgi:hypothetical protein